MTRRELFAVLPAAAAVRRGLAAEPEFERIDAHLHIRRVAPALLDAIDKAHWRCLSICVSSYIGDEPSNVDEQIKESIAVSKASKGRVQWATTFDPRGFDSPGFAERSIAVVQRSFREGAIAVKIWKNMGMGVKSKTGQWVLPDNQAYTPVYNAIEKAGKPIVAHLAEPDGAWLPLDSNNKEIGYYKNNPEWYMANKPGAPSKEAILQARDNILARHPKLRVVGAHLGSDEDHLDRLAKRLDKYPNFAVDMAARVRYFMAAGRDKSRDFLTKYQDRVLYATDFVLEKQEDAQAGQSLTRTWEQDWRYFTTNDTIETRRGKYEGLGLSPAIVRKIFRDNAMHWLPGIAPA